MIDQNLIDALYRDDVVAFAERAMLILEPGTPLKTNWHHQTIGYHLKRAFRGECSKLVINQPPKTLKTHIVSVAHAAWLILHKPWLKIAILCHDDVLANKILRSIRQIVKSEWYQALAPKTRIKADKDTEYVFETTAGGECRAFSVHGGITGHGYDYIIIDDPMKASNAHSETERRRLEQSYSSAIANRWRNPSKGVLILVMQRLHVDDFTAYFLKMHPSAIHLNIPAIAQKTDYFDLNDQWAHTFEKGELLEPDRLTHEYLEDMRRVQTNDHYEAQYLQNPQMSAGRIIKPEWLRTFSSPREFECRVISIDPAFTEDGGSNSAIIVANLIGYDAEIIYAEQKQVDYPALLNWMNVLNQIWKPDTFLIEAMGPGTALRYHLEKDSIDHVSIITSHQGKSKIARMEMVSPLIQIGHLWLPEQASWLEEYTESLTEFPYGKTSDWPDATSQLFLYYFEVKRRALQLKIQKNPPPPPPEYRHRSIHYQRWDV